VSERFASESASPTQKVVSTKITPHPPPDAQGPLTWSPTFSARNISANDEEFRVTIIVSLSGLPNHRLPQRLRNPKARGVKFKDPSPVEAPFGIAVYFTDPDGNHLTLLQPRLRLRKPCHKPNNAEHQHKDKSSRKAEGRGSARQDSQLGFDPNSPPRPSSRLSRLYDAKMVAFRVCKDNVVMILTRTQDKSGSELEQPLHLRLLVIGIQV